ncbi:SpoIID/LytB domain-containing protein [candidate division WOR-3 bacterium]|nr:SpoIID/LytB domain-containing protein [candidate division WOR-3 bacterium]
MIMNGKRIAAIALCLQCIMLSRCIHYTRTDRMRTTMRVSILENAQTVMITGIIGATYCTDKKISAQDKFPVLVKGKHNTVIVNNKTYHGNLELLNVNNAIRVINIVDMEDYLKGVVPCEIGRISPALAEAAKAQAVAARTYACAHIDQYASLGFDLYSTIRDQVYRDMSVETELTNQAIDETKGEILSYQGRPIEAKYHSTCGGQTADFNDAWPGTPPPYLQSVRCTYCETSPHFTWEKRYEAGDFYAGLRMKLKEIGSAIPDSEYIKNISLIRNKRSKRILRVEITTKVRTYTIPGYQVRALFGDKNDPGDLLKSNYVMLGVKDGKIVLWGHGFGHGVGMCQFGAIEMSRQGKTYKEILQHYYTGVKLTRMR